MKEKKMDVLVGPYLVPVYMVDVTEMDDPEDIGASGNTIDRYIHYRNDMSEFDSALTVFHELLHTHAVISGHNYGIASNEKTVIEIETLYPILFHPRNVKLLRWLEKAAKEHYAKINK